MIQEPCRPLPRHSDRDHDHIEQEETHTFRKHMRTETKTENINFTQASNLSKEKHNLGTKLEYTINKDIKRINKCSDRKS